MTTEFKDFVIDEKELDKKIADGEVSPIHLPKFTSLSDIIKFQFCTEIIKFKKLKGLKQKDIATMINVNKSEVSKLFSYNLKEFSQERLISFVETLILEGAKINLEDAWNQIKKHSKKLEKKMKSRKKSCAQKALQA